MALIKAPTCTKGR